MKFPQSLHLIEEFKKSENYLLLKDIESIRRSFKIFNGNYSDLKAALWEHNIRSVDNTLWESKEVRWDLQDNIIRLLFNFCSAAAALVPHTRNHRDRLYMQADLIYDEYEKKLDKSFRNNALHHFVIGLRNFISHDKLPVVISIRKHDGRIASTSFNLVKSSLEVESDDWKSKAKEFLSYQQNYINVEELVDKYFLPVKELHNWYSHRQLQHHKTIYAQVISEKKILLKLATEDRITTALPFNKEDIEREEQLLMLL
ncbi:hypothetical protein [Pontibacter cellulosilyticus]|uniref:Uncharacterized protein n=1 Tax=Pontibacter cellulosilyticus TaxID=1720253 RepID=A0A923SJN5_9BACT|nr:hypothetical protein [Pontibacter cellulosilyticus]MBC5993862.1 hypothetical protein [Pontibacter cellulosilyticus]